MEQPETTPDNRITISFSRNALILIALPIVFFLGLGLGFYLWEMPAESAVEAPVLSFENTAEPDEASQVEPTEYTPSVAEQVEALPRHEIVFDELDPAEGPDDAPILIVEFSDFECPYCQRHFQQVYPQLQSTYPDQIRYVFLNFPLTSIHPNAHDAAQAALCAYQQDAFWPYHALLFGGTLGLSRTAYEAYASNLSLDTEAFALCLDEAPFTDQIDSDQQQGFEIGVSSTPTFFINGIGLVGAQPFDVFAQIIDYELERLAAEPSE